MAGIALYYAGLNKGNHVHVARPGAISIAPVSSLL
jgi:hypothetical protein